MTRLKVKRHALSILVLAAACGLFGDARASCVTPHSVATIGDSNSIQHGNPETFAEYWRDVSNPAYLADNWAVGGTTAFANAAAQVANSLNGMLHTWTTFAFGTNDCDTGLTPSAVLSAIQTNVTTLSNAGTRVVLLNIPPQKGYVGWGASVQTCIDTVNAGMTATTGVYCFVDQYTALEDPNTPDTMLAAYDSGDHLHTNAAGKQAVANAITAACGAP